MALPSAKNSGSKPLGSVIIGTAVVSSRFAGMKEESRSKSLNTCDYISCNLLSLS